MFDANPNDVRELLCILLRELSVNLLTSKVRAADHDCDQDDDDDDDNEEEEEEDDEEEFGEEEAGAIEQHTQKTVPLPQRQSHLGTVPMPSAIGLGLDRAGLAFELDCNDDESNLDAEFLQGMSHIDEWRRKLAMYASLNDEQGQHAQQPSTLDFFKSLMQTAHANEEVDGFIGINDLPDDFGMNGSSGSDDEEFNDEDEDKDEDNSDNVDEGAENSMLLSFNGSKRAEFFCNYDDLNAFYLQLGRDRGGSGRKLNICSRDFSDFMPGGGGDIDVLPSAHPAVGLILDRDGKPRRRTHNKRLNQEMLAALLKAVEKYSVQCPKKQERLNRQREAQLREPREPRDRGATSSSRFDWRLDRCGMPALPSWGKGVRFGPPSPSPTKASTPPAAVKRGRVSPRVRIPEPILSRKKKFRRSSVGQAGGHKSANGRAEGDRRLL